MTTAAEARPVQKRTLKTRARMLVEARAILAETGFDGFRVEEVVRRSGVAKGTFFAHFRDRDAIFERVIADEIDSLLDDLERRAPPRTVDDVLDALMPLCTYLASERTRFDIVLRYSGAAASTDFGPVAMTFHRRDAALEKWLVGAPFRNDIAPGLLVEGIGAFATQAVALDLCAINSQSMPMRERLRGYLTAWLLPVVAVSRIRHG